MTRRGTSVRLLAAAAAVPIAVQIAYFLWSGEVGLSWIGYHAGRDPEIESWAAVLADIARALGAHAGTAFDHGSQNVTGAAARWLGRFFALASIAAALVLARRARRADADPALALLAALAVLVALAPVVSPQYLLWLAPLSAYLAPRHPLQAFALALASVLTRVELHSAFNDLPRFDWGAIALLALRNAALVAFAVALWRRRYCARERKTDQEGLSLPFVNARPVWNPPANGLRTASSRIRNHTSMSMRGFARAEATLRRSCCDW